MRLPLRLRTVADGCERLRTVADVETTGREQGSTPRPPELHKNPSLRIRKKAIERFASHVLQQDHGDQATEAEPVKRCDGHQTP